MSGVFHENPDKDVVTPQFSLRVAFREYLDKIPHSKMYGKQTMAVTIIALFLSILLIYKIFSAKFIRIAALFFISSLFIAISTGLIPGVLSRTILHQAKLDPVYEGKTVLILLGAGISESKDGAMTIPFYGYSRAVKTMSAYQSCINKNGECHIIVSGGTPPGGEVSEARIYADALIEMGVPSLAISLEERSRNTWENAKYSLSATPVEFERIFVITNSLHAKRTNLYFKHFNSSVITLSSDSVPYRLNPMHWGTNWFLYDVCLHELIGLARYHIYQALGLNKQPRNA